MSYFSIKFLPSSTTLSVSDKKCKTKPKKAKLCGEEISRFYTDLVSEPSSGRKFSVPSKVDSVKKLPRTQTSISDAKKHTRNIFWSAQDGDLDGIRYCLNEDININSLDCFGWTPLMCAACSGATDAVELLLANGADPHVSDSQGRTIVDLARQHGHLDVLSAIDGIAEDRLPRNGSVQRTSSKGVPFCTLCSASYKDHSVKHKASIVHQLNCNHTPRPTFYHLPETNFGYQLMVKKGWDKDRGLGPTGDGQKYPVKTVLKHNRHGLGHGSKPRPRVTHFDPFDADAVKDRYINQPKQKTLRKRDLLRRERREKQKEINFRNEFKC